jgi:uncharacterized protein YbjQ (UPF0145 family)
MKNSLPIELAAAFLNVSTAFLAGEVERGALSGHLVDGFTHVRVSDFDRYRENLREAINSAMKGLAEQAQTLGMGYHDV